MGVAFFPQIFSVPLIEINLQENNMFAIHTHTHAYIREWTHLYIIAIGIH